MHGCEQFRRRVPKRKSNPKKRSSQLILNIPLFWFQTQMDKTDKRSARD